MSSTQQQPDFLDEDIVRVSGQRFALLSIVSPESNQKSHDGKLAIKIRGAFDTKEEADAYIRRLQKTDPHFDIFIVDMYKWLLLPPDLAKIADIKYQEQYLNDMLQGHRESQLQVKQLFEERKRAMMERGLDANLTNEEKLPAPKGDELPPPEEFIPVPDDVPSSSSSSTK